MILVPSDIMARFQVSMDQKPVPIHHQPYYKNGFVFIGIFATNIIIRFQKNKSLIFFIEKLRHKKQKDYQIRQASDAVYLYYGIVKNERRLPILPKNAKMLLKLILWTIHGFQIGLSWLLLYRILIDRLRYPEIRVRIRIERLTDFLIKPSAMK